MAKVLTVTRGVNKIYAMETSTTNFIGNGLYNHNCQRCNGFLNGNYIMYARWMQKNHPDENEMLLSLWDRHRIGKAPKLTIIEKQALYNNWLCRGRALEDITGLQLFPKSWDYVKM